MSFNMWLAKSNFAGKRADFYEDLAEALADKGVLVQIIRTHEERAKQRKDVIHPLYALWLKRMDEMPFAECLTGTVPDSDVMILSASESSGSLIDGLRFLAIAIRAGGKMKGAVWGAIAGPMFLGCMFVALLIGYSFFLVPVLSQIMKPETWPAVGQAMYFVSKIITGYGIWLLAFIVVTTSAYIWSLPRWTGKWRAVADKYVPLYSIYRDYVGSIFLVSLASLMKARVGLSESLDALSNRASPWLRWHIRRIQSRLNFEADHPARAFQTGVFNQELTDRVMDFGSRSKFHEAIGKVGISSIEKVTSFVTSSAQLMNRILILVCGATMIFMVAGVLLTAQEAQTAIQRQTFKV